MGELFATNPGASAVEQPAGTGMSVLPGSELAAGIAPAILKLARGGQVRICPQSQLTVNAGSQGLLLAMSTGSLEVNYQVDASASDMMITPDFNIRMAGPGSYHFALGVNGRGDTCFKSLPGNTAGVVFSESMGSDLVGVAAEEAVFFPEGKLAGQSKLDHACGCPVAGSPVLIANTPAASVNSSGEDHGEHVLVASPGITSASPPEQPGQNHVQVETPFVFTADAAALPGGVAQIDFSSLPNIFLVQDEADPVVLAVKPPPPPGPPAASAKTETGSSAGPAEGQGQEPGKKGEKKGFVSRLKGFFGSLFRH